MNVPQSLKDSFSDLARSFTRITDYVLAGIVATFVRDLAHSSIGFESQLYLVLGFLLVMSGVHVFYRKGTASIEKCPHEDCDEVFELNEILDYKRYENHLWESHFDPSLDDCDESKA